MVLYVRKYALFSTCVSTFNMASVPLANHTYSYVDASRSQFNDVRGDQILHFNEFFCGSGSRPTQQTTT